MAHGLFYSEMNETFKQKCVFTHRVTEKAFIAPKVSKTCQVEYAFMMKYPTPSDISNILPTQKKTMLSFAVRWSARMNSLVTCILQKLILA